MDSQKPAIKIFGLKKRYRLGQFGGASLKEDLQSWFALKRGKPDPNLKIGSKRLNGKTFMALDGIDLEIMQGETVGIIGANGAGKSTLLKILCQITAPTEGEIELFGRITSMLEVGTGFNGEMTGRENIYQNGAILGMSKKEIDAVVEEIIDFSEVREFIDTPVKRYSSGMYVKLGFAVASHLESEIVIMDEVLAVGDLDFQRKCLSLMRTLAKEKNRTVLYVSHNMNTVRELCNRVIVIDNGKIIFDGNTEEGIQTYFNLNSAAPKFQFDFSGVSTDRKDPGATECKITTVNIHKTDSFEYEVGEPFAFTVGVLARRDFPELGMLFTITSAGIPVGTIPYISLGEFQQGERREYSVSIDTSPITEGKYDVSISLVIKDEGKIRSFDVVVDAIQFIVSKNTDFEWRGNVWGHIRLSALCERQ